MSVRRSPSGCPGLGVHYCLLHRNTRAALTGVGERVRGQSCPQGDCNPTACDTNSCRCAARSEEHTELQSRLHLVCRLLLEKKKKKTQSHVSWDIVQVIEPYR